jgi:membrane-associated phospholipid phosphatase
MPEYTRTPAHWARRLVLVGVVLAVATALANDGVPGWDASAFRVVHHLPEALEPVLWLPMQLGSVLAPGVVAALTWVLWGRWRPSVGAVVAGIGGWWAAQLVKDFVGRGRPYAVLVAGDVRSGAPHDGLGFLSGHTTVAFALAAVVSPYLTRSQRIAVYALAGTVGFARVHVGAHFPLDVVAGAALGYGLGWLWNLAVGVPASAATDASLVRDERTP